MTQVEQRKRVVDALLIPREPRAIDRNSEITIHPELVDLLRGTISEHITTISHKPRFEGQEVTIRLVTEGSGQFGLTDLADNKEWAGIFNHAVLTARYTSYLAQHMKEKGLDTHPDLLANALVISHAGRRTWDEARWYPDAAQDSEAKRSVSSETLGLRILHGKIPDNIFNLIAALGHNITEFSVNPSIYDSWDYKLAVYIDHRTSQIYEPLHTRMGDFLINNFLHRQSFDRNQIYETVFDIISKRKNEGISVDDADAMISNLVPSINSDRLSRKRLIELILQDADTEKALEAQGISPDELAEQAHMPEWENSIRKEYVAATKDEIIQRIESHIHDIVQSGRRNFDNLYEEFPANSWWGQYALDLWREYKKTA